MVWWRTRDTVFSHLSAFLDLNFKIDHNFKILRNIFFCQDHKVETCIQQIRQELPYQPDDRIEFEENDMGDKKYAYVVGELYCIYDNMYNIRN